MEEFKNSATFSITTAGGFSVLFTVREDDLKSAKSLLDLVTALDKHFVQSGVKPQVKSFGGFPKKDKEWTGDICPKDGGRLYHIKTAKGKDMCKCENGKFDFATKTTTGCDFVAWGINLKDAEEKKKAWLEAKQKVDDFPGQEY